MQWYLESMCSLTYVTKLNVDISVYLLWGCVVLWIKLQVLVLFNISPQAWWSGRRWPFETSLVLTLHNYWVWLEGWDGSVVTVQHLKQTLNNHIYKKGAMTLMTMIFWYTTCSLSITIVSLIKCIFNKQFIYIYSEVSMQNSVLPSTG